MKRIYREAAQAKHEQQEAWLIVTDEPDVQPKDDEDATAAVRADLREVHHAG